MTSARHDAYRGVAHHYDLHGWDWYDGTYGAQLLALLRERGLPAGGRVLDAGCGTGTLALRFAREGFAVTGVDLSPRMIEQARSKERGSAVDWRVADLTALELGTSFDAIVSVADVLNHLPTLDDWEAAFRCVRAHLRPGGIFFADTMTCRGLEQMDQQSVQERGGTTLILAVVWEPDARRSTLKITSFAPAADGRLYDRARETITEWGHPVGAILDRAKRAGFEELERPWAQGPDPEGEERLTILAHR
jgi:2-polyprenyl-3-methyl-5-hydroxy-6-metoxy-1,4-benzoquinol methylase